MLLRAICRISSSPKKFGTTSGPQLLPSPVFMSFSLLNNLMYSGVFFGGILSTV